ncbi:MAG: hypothetical protein WA667_08705 [Candidatus Nitrosopolaris sp.]
MLTNRESFVVFLTFVMTILATTPMLPAITIKARTEIASTNNIPSVPSLQQSSSSISKHDNNTNGSIPFVE